MKKILSLLFCFLILSVNACASQNKSDMSGYEGFDDKDHVFYDMSVKDVSDAMERKETFAVYFGFSKCPWCIAALPYLNEEAKAAGVKVGYVDTRKDPSWSSNIDIDDYDLFVEKFSDYLEYDDNGIKHLYTPHVFFVKNGETVFEHNGTVEGHDATERSLSQEEVQQLKDIYREGFEAMK